MHNDDSIVSRVGDDEVAHVVHGNALGAHELPVAVSLASEDTSRGSVWVDHQDVVDVEVGDDDVSVVVERNASRRVEVATEVSLVAKLAEEDAVLTEDQQAMVSGVRNRNATVDLVHCDVIRVDHLPVVSTL